MTTSIFQHYATIIQNATKRFRRVLGGVTSYHTIDDTHVINKDFFKHNVSIDQIVINHLYDDLSYAIFKLQTISDLLMLDDKLNTIQKYYIDSIIKGYQDKLPMLYHTIILEASKSGMHIDDDILISHEQKLFDLENKVYGPRVSDTYHEVHAILDHISTVLVYAKQMGATSLLLGSDYDFFTTILSDWSQTYKHHISTSSIAHQNLVGGPLVTMFQVAHIFARVIDHLGLPSLVIQYADVDALCCDTHNHLLTLPLGYTKKELRIYLKKMGLSGLYLIILDPHISSVATSLASITLPARYGSISVLRMCELINHEIMTHFVRAYNNQKTLIITPSQFLESEEGIAIFNEKLVSSSLSGLPLFLIDIHMISIYVGEQLSYTDAIRRLCCYFVLTGIKPKKALTMSKQRMLRVKRFHSLNHNFSNRKDVGYARGYEQMVLYFRSYLGNLHGIVEDLYDAKLTTQDLILGKDLFEGCDRCDENLLHPLPLGTMIYTMMQGNTLSLDDIHHDARFVLTGGGYVTDQTIIFVKDIVQDISLSP